MNIYSTTTYIFDTLGSAKCIPSERRTAGGGVEHVCGALSSTGEEGGSGRTGLDLEM